MFFLLWIPFVQSEPITLKTLTPTLGAVTDVSPTLTKAWEEAHKHLAKTEGQTEGYTFPTNFDEALAGPWQTISDGCSWYCGGLIEVQSASSQLPNSKANTYGADNIHDSDIRTAWVEGKDDYGIGESITLQSTGAHIEQISIWNGYQKSPELYFQNSRPKSLKLYINDQPMYVLALEDSRAVQYFTIEGTKTIDGPRRLRFEIIEVYPGSKWKDTAISEINFDGDNVH